jgi:integrase
MYKLPTYLWKNRYDKLYFRRVLTPSLRDYFGTREFKRSLRTHDRKLAIQRARHLLVALENLEKQLMGDDKDKYVSLKLLSYNGIDIDYGGDMEKELQALKAIKKMGDGIQPTLQSNQPKKPFSSLMNAYLEECESTGASKETVSTYRRNIELFIEAEGDIALTDISRDVIRKFRDKIRKLPSRRKVRPAYRDKSFADLLTMKIDKPMNQNTVDQHIARLSACFDWGVNEEWLDKNPAKSIGKIGGKANSYKPFTPDDLVALFGSSQYQNRKFKKGSHYWLPLLGLFTGARLSELVQLRLKDIFEEDGVLIFNITEDFDDGLKTKTEAGKRRVPVHSFLLQQGLREYIEFLKTIQAKRLLSDFQKGSRSWGQYATRWFKEYTEKCGVYEELTKVFHSFRHTTINRLTKEGSSQDSHIQQLVGHEQGLLIHSTYSHEPLAIQKLQEIVEKLDFNNGLPNIPSWEPRQKP